MRNYEFIQTPGAGIKAWIKGVEIEDQARQQLENVASMPFIHNYVAAIPDVHWGAGATIGSASENRTRFLIEIVDSVSRAIGADRVGVRLSPTNAVYGIGIDTLTTAVGTIGS